MTAAMAWGAYALAVSALLACGAWVVEAALRLVGRPTRWAWAGGMMGSLVVPVAAYFEAPVAGGAGLVPEGLVVALSPVVTEAAVRGGWPVDRWLLLVWLAASSLAALYVLRGWISLGRARSRWRRGEIAGVDVWMTRDLGPAVFGVRRPMIVVPGWVLGLEQRVQGLLLLHEREHVRAGDPRLVVAGVALVVALPWNPVFWWMLARLRLAVEMDCDARVLRRAPDAREYGALLLEVSRRRPRSPLLVAFSEPHRLLERRIRGITSRPGRHAAARAGVLGVLGLVPLGAALLARDPLSALDGAAGAGAVQAAQDTVTPRFTPFTVSPRLINPDEVREALQRSYPPLLRDAGIGGDVQVWFHLDETGMVRNIQLNRSSGYAALDRAALQVGEVMRFSPALNRDAPTAVWVSIPIRFRSGAEPPLPPRQPATGRAGLEPARGGDEQGPRFTPFTEAPRLVNGDEVSRALQRNYPPLLRDAGISGDVMVWVFIDENGSASRQRLAGSSGYRALDDAALRVAQVMRFRPARNRGERVAVWVAVPVRFVSQ